MDQASRHCAARALWLRTSGELHAGGGWSCRHFKVWLGRPLPHELKWLFKESVSFWFGLQGSVLSSSRPPLVSCCHGEAQGVAALSSEGASESVGEDAQGGTFSQPNSGCHTPLLPLWCAH